LDDSIEIIALVLGDATDRRWHAGQLGKGAQRLVLDLGDVAFIDSSGLRSMIRARKQVGDEAGALRIRDPQPSTMRLLEITGLTEHFPVV